MKVVHVNFIEKRVVEVVDSKQFTLMAFKQFWHDTQKPLELQVWNMIKQNGDGHRMNIGDFMIWLKYNPKIRGMGWCKVAELFAYHPQGDNEYFAIPKEKLVCGGCNGDGNIRA